MQRRPGKFAGSGNFFSDRPAKSRTSPTPGSLRSGVAAGHGGDQVVWAAVGLSGSAGDVGRAGGPVPADRGVTQGCDDGGPVAGPGLMQVFTQRHVTPVMDAVFHVPVPADPGLQIDRQGLPGG